MVVGDYSTSMVNRGSQEDGNEALVENMPKDAEAREEMEVTTVANISKSKYDTEEFESAKTSLNTGGGDEAYDAVEQLQDSPKLVSISYQTEIEQVSKAGPIKPTA